MKKRIIGYLISKNFFSIRTFIWIVLCLNTFLTYKLYDYFKLSLESTLTHVKSNQTFYVFVFLVFNSFLVCLYLKYFRRNIYREQNLRSLGFGFYKELDLKDSNGSTRKTKKYYAPFCLDTESSIQLFTYNMTIKKDYVSDRLEQISNIFNTKLLEVTTIEVRNNQLVFNLSKDLFHKLNVENDSNKFFHLYVGKKITGEKLELNLRSAFSFGIFGTSGSGKSVTAKSFMRLIRESVKGEIEIHVIDTKGVDFHDLVAEGAIYHPANTVAEIAEINSFLKSLLSLKDDTAKLMVHHGVSHAEDLRNKGVETPLKRTIIFADEASTLFDLNDVSKERKEVKKEMSILFDNCLRQLRAFGCVIGIGNQTMTKDFIFGLDNVQVLLANGISAEMNRKYFPGLDITSPVLSRWAISCQEYTGFIKTPFKLNFKFVSKVSEDKNVQTQKAFNNRSDFRKLMDDSYALTFYECDREFSVLSRNNSISSLSDGDFVKLLKFLFANNNKRESYAVRNLRTHLISLEELESTPLNKDEVINECNHSDIDESYVDSPVGDKGAIS